MGYTDEHGKYVEPDEACKNCGGSGSIMLMGNFWCCMYCNGTGCETGLPKVDEDDD